jgi:hypothetical protein
MATEGEQRHGAVLHREPGDLSVKDDIAVDQTLAVAHKASFVGWLESIAKQEKLISRLDGAPERRFINPHQTHKAIWPVAQRVENGSELGTGFKLEHAWHHRAAWDVSIAPKFVVPDIFHPGDHQRRLRKNNAVHLADGATVRNQGINGLGVMQTVVGVDAIER